MFWCHHFLKLVKGDLHNTDMKSAHSNYLFCICSFYLNFFTTTFTQLPLSMRKVSHSVMYCTIPLLPYCVSKLCLVFLHVSLIFSQISLTVIYVSLSQYVESVVSRPSLVMWHLTLVVQLASRTQSPLWPLLPSVQVYQVRQLWPRATSKVRCSELLDAC
jgi:hypothetical protein